MSDCKHLESVLHNEIPLTRAMEISVSSCSANRLELCAPLAPNLNHKRTAFGGSLYSIAVLCGWGFVFQQMHLNQLSGHIVIQHSEVDYLLPVAGEIRACCEFNDTDTLKRFIKTIQRKGQARIKLPVKILFDGKDAVKFLGHYVVHQ